MTLPAYLPILFLIILSTLFAVASMVASISLTRSRSAGMSGRLEGLLQAAFPDAREVAVVDRTGGGQEKR